MWRPYICTARQARDIDQRASEHYHIPSIVLMEHAAQACVDYLFEDIKDKRILILCGPGNNGGDGMAIARLLYQKQIQPQIFLTSLHMSESEQIQYDILEAMNIPICTNLEKLPDMIAFSEVIIDAVFGNGLARNIKGSYQQIIEWVNGASAYKIAIDIPSGLDATSGNILGCSIQTDLCIALDCYKTGHFIRKGPKTCGKTIVLDIGIPHDRSIQPVPLITKETAAACLPERSPFSHKGTFGKALMIGGSRSMHGAITMAAKACYLSGIGTLTLMIPESIADILASKMDCAMRLIGKDKDGAFHPDAVIQLSANLRSYDILSIGSGMGRTETISAMVQTVLASDRPVLLDADAFWAMRDHPEWLQRKADTILTPHIRELSYVLQIDTKEIAQDPLGAARHFSQRYPNVTLVLKSSITIVSQGETMYLLHKPNSALAKGGSGDMLCGMITGLYGQCRNPLSACICGVYLHAACADTEIDPAAFQPEDLLKNIPDHLKELRNG